MKLIFTNHAKKRMAERAVRLKNVKETIDFPDYTVATDNKMESHKKIGDKILKIVYFKEENYIKIVTLMWK